MRINYSKNDVFRFAELLGNQDDIERRKNRIP